MKWFVLAGETAGDESTSAEGVEKVTKWLGNPEGSAGGAGWSEYHKHLQIFTAAAEAVKKHPLWQGELKQEPMVTSFPGLALTVFLFKSESGNRIFTAFEASGYEGVVVKQKEVEVAANTSPTSAEVATLALEATAELAEAQPEAETTTATETQSEAEAVTSPPEPKAEAAMPEAEVKAQPEAEKSEATQAEGEGEKAALPFLEEEKETQKPAPVAVQPEG